MTKEQMDSVVGIHPTCAEDCIGLTITKEENPDAEKTGCWAWTMATGWFRAKLWEIPHKMRSLYDIPL